jgi:transposase
VPKPFPREFRRDVIAVARQGNQSIAQVARNFGISESCLSRWLKIADREDGITPGAPAVPVRTGESDLEAENRELRKRVRAGERDPKAAGYLCTGLVALAGDRDHVTTEILRIRRGHDADPSSEDPHR